MLAGFSKNQHSDSILPQGVPSGIITPDVTPLSQPILEESFQHRPHSENHLTKIHPTSKQNIPTHPFLLKPHIKTPQTKRSPTLRVDSSRRSNASRLGESGYAIPRPGVRGSNFKIGGTRRCLAGARSQPILKFEDPNRTIRAACST